MTGDPLPPDAMFGLDQAFVLSELGAPELKAAHAVPGGDAYTVEFESDGTAGVAHLLRYREGWVATAARLTAEQIERADVLFVLALLQRQLDEDFRDSRDDLSGRLRKIGESVLHGGVLPGGDRLDWFKEQVTGVWPVVLAFDFIGSDLPMFIGYDPKKDVASSIAVPPD